MVGLAERVVTRGTHGGSFLAALHFLPFGDLSIRS